MTSTPADSGEGPSVQRLTIHASEADLADLRSRLDRTRWPSGAHDGWSAGIDPGYLRSLVEHWRTSFDWRAAEERLNRYEHLLVPVAGSRIHVVRAARRSAKPALLLLHGWPGSFVQMLDLMDRLQDDFDVVAGSLPGFAWSDPPRGDRRGEARIADLFDEVMTAGLGHTRYAVHGTDFGAGVAGHLAATHADHLIGVHLGGTSPRADGVRPDDAPALQRYAADVAAWRAEEVGYSAQQSTKPETLAVALSDSPAGLAAWLVEKFRRWSDSGGDVERRFTKDELLTNVMVYWLTDSIGTSIALYRDADDDPDLREARVPIAHLMSDRDMLPTPREWVERSSRIDRWTRVDRGGHFIEWEEPDLVADDLRAFLTPLV